MSMRNRSDHPAASDQLPLAELVKGRRREMVLSQGEVARLMHRAAEQSGAYCLANLADLQALRLEPAPKVRERRQRFFESSAGLLRACRDNPQFAATDVEHAAGRETLGTVADRAHHNLTS